MTRPQLLALAARVEAAQGADRELDRAIAEGIGWRFPHEGFATTPEGRSVLRSHVPRFTASLDAATTLMPPAAVTITVFGDGTVLVQAVRNGVVFEASGRTEPNARTAAALRARAEEAGDE